ncbi:MAG: 5'/3'-nucleotidase SurE [Acidobacteria bacterium]|nr:5'/3'-nucleotidase SurE [Acidobacteriota bacterium]
MKRILITNDDGIHAPGLKALEKGLMPLGEVTVVAPDREMSATSQSISLHTPLRIHAIDERHYAVAGTPADTVIIALHHLLKEKPDLVVSGINPGGNLGENVIYSGTVAAAMEATLHGVPAIAISLASRKRKDFSAAAAFAVQLAAKVLEKGLPRGIMLNVNVPRDEVRGMRITRQSQKISQNVVIEQEDPRGRPYYWLDETSDLGLVEPDSDYAAILAHEVSITPLQVDRTDYASLNHLSRWLPTLQFAASK